MTDKLLADPLLDELVYVDTVLDYFDSGAGPLAGPYGGTFPGSFPVPISTDAVLGGDDSPTDFVSLPSGSYITVGYSGYVVVDGSGDDIFVEEVGGNETAEVFVSSDGYNFVSLGIASGGGISSFNLGSIGFVDPVSAIKVIGLDNGGGSPGFDLANVYSDSVQSRLPDAQTLFSDEGKIVVFAELALSAYHLRSDELDTDDVNERNYKADEVYGDVFGDFGNGLEPVATSDLWPTGLPTGVGFSEGIYTNDNAAALLARADDALFISFRGTNDNSQGYGIFDDFTGDVPPDVDDWNDMSGHYDLFADLIPAIEDYLAANPDIETVYVTGHSLGAGMAHAFMDAHPDGTSGVTFEALTFASPGYEFVDLTPDSRITNIWNINDPILKSELIKQSPGSDIFFEPTLGDIGDFHHSMNLYLEFAKHVQNSGLQIDDLSPSNDLQILKNLNVVDFDIDIQIETNGDVWPEFNIVADGSSVIQGSYNEDFLIGSSANDSLSGLQGDDWYFGGEGNDQFVFSNPGIIDGVKDANFGSTIAGGIKNVLFDQSISNGVGTTLKLLGGMGKVVKATLDQGDGHDLIFDFQDDQNYQDKILIDSSYGFDSAEDVLAEADIDGTNVILNLSSNSTVTLDGYLGEGNHPFDLVDNIIIIDVDLIA